MLWQDLRQEVAARLRGNSALADQRPFIYIDSRAQRLHYIDIEAEYNRSYAVSTAANGQGNRLASYKTPFGIHRICQKIGGGQPGGAVFEARQPTGRIASDLDNREQDEITSRIMWLDGLEDGVNRGGVYDTYARYIYIHGTSDEGRIGEPVSAGCIRMKNAEVIELFDEVLINDLVVIK
jgi:lipoprotein-anchoring transpeptidase ErfK/SrfK